VAGVGCAAADGAGRGLGGLTGAALEAFAALLGRFSAAGGVERRPHAGSAIAAPEPSASAISRAGREP